MNIKLIVFDLDGTLVKYENSRWYGSWDAVGYAAGLEEEWDKLTKYYYPHKHLYEEWILANAKLLRGVEVKKVTEKIFPPPYSEGVKQVVPELNKSYPTMILSSGVNLVANRVKEELGIRSSVSNVLCVKDGHFTGEGKCIVPVWKKHLMLRKLVNKLGIKLDEICVIGDNENDIPSLEIAGLGIAFQPRTKLVEIAAEFSIENFSELSEILQAP